MRLLVSCMACNQYRIYSTWADESNNRDSKFCKVPVVLIMDTTALMMCSMLIYQDTTLHPRHPLCGEGDLDAQARLVQEEL